MKAKLFRLLVACHACQLLVSPVFAQQDAPATIRQVAFEDGDSIVFLGDSITHQCLYTQYVEDFLYTRYPALKIATHNSGVGGARAWDALQRFERDVAAYQPDYVTVLLGMNDGSYRPYDESVFQNYRKDMTTLLGRIRELDATPILMTPTMFDARAARATNRPRPAEMLELYNSVLAFYGSWLREVAFENGTGFVDMFSPLDRITWAQRSRDPDFTLIRDAVHPDPPGQLVMATALIEGLGLRRQVSNINITLDAKLNATTRASGGELADLSVTEGGLRFTWRAESLPWVVPEAAASAVKLLNLGPRLSRETLEVHGLPRGRYELSIDGEAVGEYWVAALERGVELQSNTSTPQYRQALQVAELNQQRNAGPVHALRDEWRAFQSHARSRAELDQNGDNEDLKKQVADLATRLEGMDERIAQHEEQARAIEGRIRQSNQPPARAYSLRRIAGGRGTGE